MKKLKVGETFSLRRGEEEVTFLVVKERLAPGEEEEWAQKLKDQGHQVMYLSLDGKEYCLCCTK